MHSVGLFEAKQKLSELWLAKESALASLAGGNWRH